MSFLLFFFLSHKYVDIYLYLFGYSQNIYTEISESKRIHIFILFDTHYQVVFQKWYINLPCHQLCMKVPLSSWRDITTVKLLKIFYRSINGYFIYFTKFTVSLQCLQG